MGASASSRAHELLQKDVVPLELRSERQMELDEAHPEGLWRPALKLGESFTLKQQYAADKKSRHSKLPGMRFHTDARAVERQTLEAKKTEENDANKQKLIGRENQTAFVQAARQFEQLERVQQYLQAAADGKKLPDVTSSVTARISALPPLSPLGRHSLELSPTQDRSILSNQGSVQGLTARSSVQQPSRPAVEVVAEIPSPERRSPSKLKKGDGALQTVFGRTTILATATSPTGSGAASSPSPPKPLPARSTPAGQTSNSGVEKTSPGNPARSSQSQLPALNNIESPTQAQMPYDQLIQYLHGDTEAVFMGDRSSAPAMLKQNNTNGSTSPPKSGPLPSLPFTNKISQPMPPSRVSDIGGLSPSPSKLRSRSSVETPAALRPRGSMGGGGGGKLETLQEQHSSAATGDLPPLNARISALREKLEQGAATSGQALLAASERRQQRSTPTDITSNLRAKMTLESASASTSASASLATSKVFDESARTSRPGNQDQVGAVSGISSGGGGGGIPTARGASLPNLGAAGNALMPTVNTTPDAMDMEWAAAQVMRVSMLPAPQRRQQLTHVASEVKSHKEAVRAALQSCVSRCNSSSMDRFTWSIPHVDPTPCTPAWKEMDPHPLYLNEAINSLQTGKVAVQIFADADVVQLPDGSLVDWWGLEPWAALALQGMERPRSAYDGVVEGVCMGTRLLAQLLLILEAVTGEMESATRMPIILHIHDGQRDQVEADMIDCSLYERWMHRLIVIQHPRQHGYKYDTASGLWREALDAPLQSCGEGMSMAQMTWPGQALMMSSIAKGRLEPQAKPALQLLADWGVKWLVSWRSNDCHLMCPDPYSKETHSYMKALIPPSDRSSDSAQSSSSKHRCMHNAYAAQGHILDPSFLAYCMYLNSTQGATCVLQADNVRAQPTWHSTPITGGKHEGFPEVDRILLQPGKAGAVNGNAGPTGRLATPPASSVVDDREVEKLLNIRLQSVSRLRQVQEISGYRSGGAALQQAIAKAGQAVVGGLMVGAQRYVFHLPTLSKLLQSPLSIRPALRLGAHGMLRLQMELSDITQSWQICAAAVQLVGGRKRGLVSSKDLEGWVKALGQQDAALHALETRPAYIPQAVKSIQQISRPPSLVRHNIVVLLADNAIAKTCVAAACMIARPSVDTIYLVNISATNDGRTDAADFLSPFAAIVKGTGVRAEIVVESKEQCSVREALETAITSVRGSMIVTGSIGLVAGTSFDPNVQLVSDSFSLYLMQTLCLPTLLVTTKCKIALPAQPRAPLRSMMLSQGHSRPLLHYLAGLLSQGGNQPCQIKLLLGQVYNPKLTSHALASSIRLLADKFVHIAEGHHLTGVQAMQLDPPYDTAMLSSIKAHMLHLLAVQLPSDVGQPAAGARFLPAYLMNVLRGSTVPVLVYPRRHADVAHAAVPVSLSTMAKGSKVFLRSGRLDG